MARVGRRSLGGRFSVARRGGGRLLRRAARRCRIDRRRTRHDAVVDDASRGRGRRAQEGTARVSGPAPVEGRTSSGRGLAERRQRSGISGRTPGSVHFGLTAVQRRQERRPLRQSDGMRTLCPAAEKVDSGGAAGGVSIGHIHGCATTTRVRARRSTVRMHCSSVSGSSAAKLSSSATRSARWSRVRAMNIRTIEATQQQQPRRGRANSCQKAAQRRLAAARGALEQDAIARVDAKVAAREHGLPAALVREHEVVALDERPARRAVAVRADRQGRRRRAPGATRGPDERSHGPPSDRDVDERRHARRELPERSAAPGPGAWRIPSAARRSRRRRRGQRRLIGSGRPHGGRR